jgi:hypothetical protein
MPTSGFSGGGIDEQERERPPAVAGDAGQRGATLTKGGSQTVTVDTDPSGAACTLMRDAELVAVVNPTPGSVPVEKAQGTVAIACKKQGYLEATGNLASAFQAMTFGNILFGGIIGIAIDAASGAMHQYPDSVTITLIPDGFATTGARDDFFDRFRAALAREDAEVRDRIEKSCARSDCDRQLATADAAKAEKLATIEQGRASAKSAGRD